MALKPQALDTASTQLWKGITDARAKLIDMLQGEALRSADQLHALIEEIQAYIAALDLLHDAQTVTPTTPPPVTQTPAAPTPVASAPLTPAETAGQQAIASALGVSVADVLHTAQALTGGHKTDPSIQVDDINSINRGFVS